MSRGLGDVYKRQMLQLGVYHITPDEDYDRYEICRGLGLVNGLDLEVHYLATDLQLECSLRAANELCLPVYRMRHEGGLLIDGCKITKLGGVEIVKP